MTYPNEATVGGHVSTEQTIKNTWFLLILSADPELKKSQATIVGFS